MDIEITDQGLGDSIEVYIITAVISSDQMCEEDSVLTIDILACPDEISEEYQGTNEEERPYFEDELEDQSVLVGNALIYKLPEVIHPLDLNVTKEVTLGESSFFTNYNEGTDIIYIIRNETTESFVGTYHIHIRLKDSNDTYSTQTYSLSLTIVPRQETSVSDTSIEFAYAWISN